MYLEELELIKSLEEVIKDRDLLQQTIREIGIKKLREIRNSIREEKLKLPITTLTMGDYDVQSTKTSANNKDYFHTRIINPLKSVENKGWLIYARKFRTEENALVAHRILAQHLEKRGY